MILDKAPSRHSRNGVKSTNGVNGTNGINGTNGVNGRSVTNGAGSSPARRVFVFSAKSEKSLTSYLSSFDDYLDEEAPDTSDFVKNLSYTLGQRRTHHPYRVSVVADSVASLQEKLLAVKPRRSKDQVVAFVFTGQGAQ